MKRYRLEDLTEWKDKSGEVLISITPDKKLTVDLKDKEVIREAMRFLFEQLEGNSIKEEEPVTSEDLLKDKQSPRWGESGLSGEIVVLNPYPEILKWLFRHKNSFDSGEEWKEGLMIYIEGLVTYEYSVKILEWLYTHDGTFDSSQEWREAFLKFLKEIL